MDTLTAEERSARMARVRSKDTAPEISVRKMLHRLGYRFRLHRKDLPGQPDIVFGQRKKIIFVHGCFWHGHTDSNCRLARLPKSKLDFWKPKLTANAVRDARVEKELHSLGWRILVVWECQIGQSEQLENKLVEFLEE